MVRPDASWVCRATMRRACVKQPGREFPPGCTKARAQDAALQVTRLSSALSLDACSSSQHVQSSTPPCLPPHTSDLQGRGGTSLADCDCCGVTRPNICAGWLWPSATQVAGEHGAQLQDPAPDGFVGGLDAPLRQKLLDIAVAQREPEIEPGGMPDDLGRELVAGIGDGLHRAALPRI